MTAAKEQAMLIPASERIRTFGRFTDVGSILRRIRLEERSGAYRRAAAWARIGRKLAEKEDLPNLLQFTGDYYDRLRRREKSGA